VQLVDLFSGIGAFSLAGKQVWGDELEILGFSEIKEFPIKVYQKNFPGVPNRVDRVTALGNSIYVPILIMIFECMKQVEELKRKEETPSTINLSII